MKHKRIFIVVSVDDRLPGKEGMYAVIFKSSTEWVGEARYFKNKGFCTWEKEDWVNVKNCTHWLEEKKDEIVFTLYELECFYSEAYTEGLASATSSGYIGKSFSEFLKSKGLL